jgi:threonine/homoserine/homoserine lactone efflux protein
VCASGCDSSPPTRLAGNGYDVNGSLFVAYLVTVVVLMLTPGPDMLFCLATGLRGGSRAGFRAALGAATGEVIHISAAALGLAAVFRAAPLLFDAVRFAGACYLIILGLSALRNRNRQPGDGVPAGAHAYRRGVATNLLNPKMALFTIAFLPQFVDPGAGSLALQFLILGACFVALEIVVDGTVGLVAGRLADLFRRRRVRRNLNVAAGSIYIGLGARLALDR